MKKLNLSSPMFQDGDVLSRSQLKKVLGGDGGYSDSGGGYGSTGPGGSGSGPGVICHIWLIEDGGHGSGHYSTVDGSLGTALASSFCNNAVALNPGWVCTYTCP